MDSTLLAVKHEFLKRDLIQVSIGYAIACVGMLGVAIKASKLESKLNKLETEKEEIEHSNKELLKDISDLKEKLSKARWSQANS